MGRTQQTVQCFIQMRGGFSEKQSSHPLVTNGMVMGITIQYDAILRA